MITYFVSYAHDRGFGCTAIELRYPVRSMTDIKVLVKVIENGGTGLCSVVILNFQRFESATPERSAA